MRILLITSQYAPEIGGVPRLLSLYGHHRPTNSDLRVLSVRHQSPDFYAKFDQQSPVIIERIAPRNEPGLTSAIFQQRLRQTVNQWAPDVVLSGVAYPTAIMARLAYLQRPFPYIIYAHSEDVTIQNPIKRALLRWALRRAQAVITVSQFTANELAKLGVATDLIHIIPPGIEIKPFATAQPRADWSGKWVLLTVARLIPRKGQDTVIRALPQMLNHVPNLHYVVVSSGPGEADLRQLADELGVSEQVTFTGSVSDADLPAYYQTCNAFVMVTRPGQGEVEGFGITFLEAGAAEKPVIAGRAGGVADAVQDNITGLLVDPLNVQATAEAIIRLAQNPALAQRLGQAGYDHVMKNHTATVFAERVTAVLKMAGESKVKSNYPSPASNL